MTIEQLVYSTRVKKFNRFALTQERIFVVTNKKVYNIKKQSKYDQLIVKVEMTIEAL